jgi:hypothetical protein
MPTLSAMTELEAVNEMLMSIGQAPVSTLEVTGIKDVNIAKAELLKVSRRVQSQGWSWNSDHQYELAADADGYILVPANVIKIDASDKTSQLVQRRHPTKGMAIYNKHTQSFIFDHPVKFDVVWLYPFEDLPETARCYIATSAGRKFQSRVIGSRILDEFQAIDEMTTWTLLMREERASRDSNWFRRNPEMIRFQRRFM